MESCVIIFNVNGFRYEIREEKVLEVFGNSSWLTKCFNEDPPCTEIKVNRPMHIFEAILDYCNTGHLHIPLNVCIGAFVKELGFWEIDIQCLEQCCYHRYLTFIKDRENLDYFLKSLQPKAEESEGNSSNSWKERVWQVVDGRRIDTCWSKIFATVSITFVAIAIINVAVSTLQFPDMYNTTRDDQISLNTTGVTDRFVEYPEHRTKNVTSLKNITTKDTDFFIFPNESRQKVLMTRNTQTHLYIEHVTNAFFTTELLVRLSCCPSILQYFYNSMNILDSLLLVSSYIRYTIMLTDTMGTSTVTKFLLYLQVLRILLIFRFSKHVTSFHILCFIVKHGFRDFFNVIMFLFMIILIFSNFLYFVESSNDVPSIPDAWCFSIVTMTTVGFWDITPKTWIGKMIGGLCALTGIMIFSLAIPIFVIIFQRINQLLGHLEKRKIKGHMEEFVPVSMREIEVRCREQEGNIYQA